jgi:hypothetical protein
MEIYQHRGGLLHTLAALKKGSLTVGFIGGSITDARPEWNWPEPVSAWFVENFPGVRVQIENAAIGATGSDLAVFRAERDLIGRGCDLVFVEFAVNDEGSPAEQRMRSREGLLRKLLQGAGRDVVLTYTYSQAMYADMLAGRLPASIADFERLAVHYQIGSVWMGWHALQDVQRGRMRWEEWVPDGLHPQFRGSLSYAQSVMAYLERELRTHPSPAAILMGANLPAPLNPRHWADAYRLPWSEIQTEGPWTLRRWPKLVWIDQVLRSTAVGARVKFEFEGRGLLLGLDFGKASAEFRYCLDGGEWKLSGFDRPDWVGADGWYRTLLVGDDLPGQRHTFELEVFHGNPGGNSAVAHLYSGTNFNLALVGVIP